MKITKYTAIFKSGKELSFTSKEFRNRLDVYNYICLSRLGKKYGELLEIRCTPFPG